ncbi:MAG: hypothetical protein HOP12_13965 [Candidatus Eisenbacteria bacterium]|uniref:PKD domain-containing protein n=1 Tax=Eiseniibacteriota bacterium TaxID=2212470 RepID=A0A849ST56_UNCEI|nr:hypothetical protein [Candidatus Eisenbacteria bacterium]
MKSRMWSLLAATLLVAALTGCAKKPQPAEETTTEAPPPAPFSVTSVSLGKAIRPDMSVDSAVVEFGARDTIYASVASDGSSSGVTLTAKWTFEDGSVVNESSQTIAPTGPAVTVFHVAMPKPWPKGKYHVDVWADSTSAGGVDYAVK